MKVIRFLLLIVNPIIIPIPFIGAKWEASVSSGSIGYFVRKHRKDKPIKEREIFSRRVRQSKPVIFTFTGHPPTPNTIIRDDEGNEWNNGMQHG